MVTYELVARAAEQARQQAAEQARQQAAAPAARQQATEHGITGNKRCSFRQHLKAVTKVIHRLKSFY